MKHLQKLGYILVGSVLTATAMLAAPAIAAQIQTITATANTVNIALDGKQVAAKGANYTLDNGTQVPYSLSYNGTTYLPMRKVGELVGKDIYWDQATGTAGVGVNPKAEIPVSDDKPAGDYSDWTAEEEKAYQEFVGMWEVETRPDVDTGSYVITPIFAHYDTTKTNESCSDLLLRVGKQNVQKYTARMGGEFFYPDAVIRFVLFDESIWKLEVYLWRGIDKPDFEWNS